MSITMTHASHGGFKFQETTVYDVYYMYVYPTIPDASYMRRRSVNVDYTKDTELPAWWTAV